MYLLFAINILIEQYVPWLQPWNVLKNRKKQLLVNTLFVVLLVYCAYCLVTVCLMLVQDYDYLTNWFISNYPDAFLVAEYRKRYFTHEHYLAIQQFGPVAIGAVIGIMLFFIAKRKLVSQNINLLIDDLAALVRTIRESIVNITKQQKILLWSCLAILLLTKLFLFSQFPYQVDEVFNFVFFVSKGFLHSTIYSNNHILYNIISTFWWKIGFSPIISSRLTSIIVSIVVHLLVYSFVRRQHNFHIAIGTMMITGLTFWSGLFSIQASAYYLVILFWLCGVIAIAEIKATNYNRGIHLFTLSGILGLYSSKLFVIPLLSFALIFVFLLLNSGDWRRGMKSVSISFLVIAGCTTLLYFPMLLWSGASSVFVTTIPNSNLLLEYPTLLESFSVMTDVNSKSYLALIVFVVFLLMISRKKGEMMNNYRLLAVVNIATLTSIIVFILVTHLYPPSRAFIYLNTLFYMSVAIGIGILIAELENKKQIALVWLICIGLKVTGSWFLMFDGWQSHLYGEMQDNRFYDSINSVSKCIASIKPHTVTFDTYHETTLDYYIRLQLIQNKVSPEIVYSTSHAPVGDIFVTYDIPLSDQGPYTEIPVTEFGYVYVRKDALPDKTCQCCSSPQP